MDLLYDAASAWLKLLDYKYNIICGKSRKLHTISLDFDETDFFHIAGFPHVKDIVFPIRFSKSATLKKVLDGTITEQIISPSENYEKIVKPKLLAVCKLEELLNHCFDVYLFNPKLLPFHTDIQAKYLFVDKRNQVVFLFTDTKRHDEPFFSRSAFVMESRDYRCNQSSMTVLKIEQTTLSTGFSKIIYCRDDFSS